jgi:arylsulfatase
MKFKGPWELYDMEADRTEQHNLVDKEPEIAQKLIAEWEAWAARSDVDPWQGEVRSDWGEEIKKPAAKKAGRAKNAVPRKRRPARTSP